jgi:hypothetical protein
MNAVLDIDCDIELSGISTVGIPENLAAVVDGLVDAEVPFFTKAEEGVLSAPGSSSARGEYHEVREIRMHGLVAVPAVRVLARFAAALPQAEFARASRRHTSHINLDLYGYSHSAGLAVVQVRSGSWDSKYGFGTMSKTYVIVETFGNSITVPPGKLRAAARLHPFELVRPLTAALRDVIGTYDADSAVPVRLYVRQAAAA